MAKTCRTCKHTDPGCLIRIRGNQGLDCWYHEARETPLLVDELAEALKAIHQGAEAQFKYLTERGRTPPHGSDGRVLELRDCQWAGIHETDARHTYPNRLHLIDGVVEAALSRYQKEVSDGEVS